MCGDGCERISATGAGTSGLPVLPLPKIILRNSIVIREYRMQRYRHFYTLSTLLLHLQPPLDLYICDAVPLQLGTVWGCIPIEGAGRCMARDHYAVCDDTISESVCITRTRLEIRYLSQTKVQNLLWPQWSLAPMSPPLTSTLTHLWFLYPPIQQNNT